jgi:hypothetical protein
VTFFATDVAVGQFLPAEIRLELIEIGPTWYCVASKRRLGSPLVAFLAAASAGAAVALVNYLLGLWLAARGEHAELTLVDEFLLGIFTGVLVFVIELMHHRNQARMNEKLRTIELMNHHVRNALQNIIDLAFIHGHLDEVRTSVDRIAWALQEILPGQTSDANNDPGGASHEEARAQVRRK